MKLCILVSIVMGVFAWMQTDCLVSVWLPKKDFHLLVVVRFLSKSIWTQRSRPSVGSFLIIYPLSVNIFRLDSYI